METNEVILNTRPGIFQPHVDEFIVGTTTAPTDWPSLIKAEPALKRLADSIPHCFGRSEHEWVRLKSIFSRLVGDDARRPHLRSKGLFEIASFQLRRRFERRGGAR